MSRRTTAIVLTALLLTLPCDAGALMSLRVGDAPPPFELADLAGNRVGSDALAGAPSVVLFWSTWSPRSAEMFDDFTRHAAAHAARGLKIVAINIDGENLGAAQRAAVREYAASRALPFPVLLDEGLKTFAAWGVMAHPTEVVLDAGGRIAYVLPGYPETLREELEAEIGRALGIATAPAAAAAAPVAPQEEAARTHASLGRHFLARGDLERAREEFQKAAAADPSSLEASVTVARTALALGSRAEAEHLARQVSPDAINRGDLRFLLGNLMLSKGDLAAAERTFRALHERLPSEGWGAWGLGIVALARGEHREALRLMQQASRMQPQNLEATALMLRHYRDRCQRRLPLPEEEGFVAVFPALAELRERYCRLFAPRPQATEAPAP
jgi:Tfp pilus assembly protein PilF/peroxiredoxin